MKAFLPNLKRRPPKSRRMDDQYRTCSCWPNVIRCGRHAVHLTQIPTPSLVLQWDHSPANTTSTTAATAQNRCAVEILRSRRLPSHSFRDRQAWLSWQRHSLRQSNCTICIQMRAAAAAVALIVLVTNTSQLSTRSWCTARRNLNRFCEGAFS
jgi:hypothetical protein